MTRKYLALATFFIPTLSWAWTYAPLAGNTPLPDSISGLGDITEYLLTASVALAAILAVIMLAIGGFKYMTSESVFKLGDAKEQIVNAVVGLLVVLAAILVLTTINPGMIANNIFLAP